jgi:hypothetical protein
MDSPAGLVLRVCCSSRCRLTALTSIALFLLILLTSATNYLSVPWTTISSSTVLARSVNSTTFQLRLELRSLTGQPLVFGCQEVHFNTTPPAPTLFQPCQKNSTSPPLSSAAAGFDEAQLKRTTLSMVLVSLGLVVCAIAAVLGFQFHACRMDDSGRPLPGSRLCLRSPRQVVLALVLAVAAAAACGFLMAYSTRFYAVEVTAKWLSALPPEEYTVAVGSGVAALQRISSYAWGATAVLLLAACFGPLKWHSDGEPFAGEEEAAQQARAGGARQAQAQALALARGEAARAGSTAFYLREIVTLPVVAVPSSAGEGVGKTEFGWPLPRAAYASPPPPAPAAAAQGGFFFSTPLRRGGSTDPRR